MEATAPQTRTSAIAASTRPFTLSRGARRALLTVHIAASVGLLGEVGAFLVVAITAAGTESLVVESVSYDLLATFSALFGIPLSATALATGVLLGVGGKWGVLRSRWVGIKLVLLASVIVVGAAVLGPSVAEMRTGSQGLEARIVAGATWDVLALTLATGLSVYKPGGRRIPRRRGLPSNPR